MAIRGAEEDLETPYAPPTHLNTSGTIGPIPDRSFYIVLAVGVLSLPFVLYGWQTARFVGAIAAALPFLILAFPFALPINPPAEHGLGRIIAFRFSRKVLLPQHHKWLHQLRIEKGVVYLGKGTECCAVLAMPTINLELASVAAKTRHRRQLGIILDGIATHQLQIVVRADTQGDIAAINRMRLHRNPVARRLADWLAEHHQQRQTIDRRRYVIIPAPDPDTLTDRVTNITGSWKQAGLDPERVEEVVDLRDIIDHWWTWRPHEERIGPERVDVYKDAIQSDGHSWMRVFAMAGFPSTITTDWLSRLLDGDLPVDVSMTLLQQDLELAKFRLGTRYNSLASSPPSPGRQIALEQVALLRRGFEGRTRPWDCQMLLIARGHDKASLDKNTSLLKQRMRDMGAKIKLLKWEQYQGAVAAMPLCQGFMPHRKHSVETGTLARTTMFAASTLQMRDGVPMGMAGSTPVLLTTKHARSGRHFGWYGFTGSGKGFNARMYLTRRHFADGLRIFVWDSDDAQHEYAGRWCTFMQGVRLEMKTLDDVLTQELDPRWQVVVFDVSELPENDQPRAFAHIKHQIERHVLEFPGETAVLVDEATTLAYARDRSGSDALGHAVQTWRKRGIEFHVLTQRVTDWFNTEIGRKVQGNLAVQLYGAQNDSEIADVALKVRLSAEETDRVGAAGTGEFLIVAFGRRVWVNMFEHASPEEYIAYHTDPPDRMDILATRRRSEVA